jgi:hypothetical protein
VVLEIVTNRDLSFTVPTAGRSEPRVFEDDYESGDLSAWSNAEGAASVKVAPRSSNLGGEVEVGNSTFDVAPTSLHFGRVLLGATAPEQSVFVTNRSRAGLSLGLIGMVGDQAQSFLILGDRCSGTFLELGEGCSFSVILLTLDEGEFHAQVQIPNSAEWNGGLAEMTVDGAVLWPGGTP